MQDFFHSVILGVNDVALVVVFGLSWLFTGNNLFLIAAFIGIIAAIIKVYENTENALYARKRRLNADNKVD